MHSSISRDTDFDYAIVPTVSSTPHHVTNDEAVTHGHDVATFEDSVSDPIMDSSGDGKLKQTEETS